MPGGSGARSAKIETADEIDYYNVTINNQEFKRLKAGASVESSPITVGATVHITVEAIGNIIDSQTPVIIGGRVAYYETTRTMENGGINISVKMKDYITEYCRIDFSYNDTGSVFHGLDSWKPYVYVEKGKTYTLPNYGTYTPSQGAPQKHTGWTYGQTGKVAAGGSITINSDMTFMLETGDDDSYARFEFRAIGTNIERFQSFSTWKAEDYVKKGTSYELPDFSDPSHYITVKYGTVHGMDVYTAIKHSGWTGVSTTGGSPTSETYKPGQTVENIQGDITFIIKTINSTAIKVVTAEGGTGITITESLPTGIYRLPNQLTGVYGDFIIWSDESFTAPSATKQDGSSVTMWELRANGVAIKTIAPGVSVTYDEWLQAVEKNSDGDVLQLYASD